ncbi:MAG: hypothetical protein WCL11_29460, partial [Verrucomicrobiota bacterium]
ATPYYYVVSAVSPGGEGANSGQVGATTWVLTAPGFSPGGISVSSGTVSLVGTGGLGATYTLWASTNVGLPLSNWTQLTHTTITVSPFTNLDAGATTNQQRFYRFTAP